MHPFILQHHGCVSAALAMYNIKTCFIAVGIRDTLFSNLGQAFEFSSMDCKALLIPGGNLRSNRPLRFGLQYIYRFIIKDSRT
jgi:hypothetical protein